jgi:hypothetical protein
MPVFACVGETVYLLVPVLVLVVVFAGEPVLVPAPVFVLSAVRVVVLVGERGREWGPGDRGSYSGVLMGVGVASTEVSVIMGWQTGQGSNLPT